MRKFVLASISLNNFSFYKFCLFMCRLSNETCTQMSDSVFSGKINVVSLGDSAKRDSSGRRDGFSHVNASPTKMAGPPPYKHPLNLYNFKSSFK